MATTPNEQAWWGKTRNLVIIALVIWFVFGYLIHAFAPALNGIRMFGFPLGYWFASQGALVVFVVLCFWFSSAQDKIDREHGVAEE
jgi:putative solute:sodium symporter small subunit